MKHKILIIFLFFTYNTYSQVNEFTLFPAKGNISKLEIFEMVGDGLNKKEMPLISKVFDKNGFEISNISYNFRTYTLSYNENSYIKKDEIITYKCKCPNTIEFEKKFKIKDKPAPENKTKYMGNGGGGQPSTVDIKKIDKNGNIVLQNTYNENGLKIFTVKSSFDNKNRLIKRENFDLNNNIIYFEENKYDDKNNLIEKKAKFKTYPFETKENFKYNTKNQLIEHIKYENNLVSLNYEYTTSIENNKEEITQIDKLKNTIVKKDEIYYNQNHKEIKSLSFSSSGDLINKIENDYFDNGNLKSRFFYKNDDTITKKIFFLNDKNNNWKEIIMYQSTIREEAKSEIIEKKYIQKISYKQ